MKKTKSFIAIILLFSLLFCFSISKAAAATGHYVTVVDRAGWTQTITRPGYYTSVTTRGEWVVVPSYKDTRPGWTELVISKFHVNLGSLGVIGTTSYVYHPAKSIVHPASRVYVSYPATTKQVWHPETYSYVRHPAITHRQWVVTVH